MNERENFINNLERAMTSAYGQGREFVKLTIGDMKRILQLLKEQEAVPVIQREVMHMLIWCCGSCGVPIKSGEKFCWNCGKKVKRDD